MPRYGLTTQKTGPRNPAFNNRYWVNADSLGDAQIMASTIIDIEQKCFGELVRWVNTHVWLPNSTPNQFSNTPRNEPGGLFSENPIKSEICAELLFGTDGSYMSRKVYRVQVDAGMLVGTGWHSTMLTQLALMVVDFEAMLPFLTDDSGKELTSVALNPEYVFMQVGKRWYNRTGT